jgi:hypothetical protein
MFLYLLILFLESLLIFLCLFCFSPPWQAKKFVKSIESSWEQIITLDRRACGFCKSIASAANWSFFSSENNEVLAFDCSSHFANWNGESCQEELLEGFQKLINFKVAVSPFSGRHVTSLSICHSYWCIVIIDFPFISFLCIVLSVQSMPKLPMWSCSKLLLQTYLGQQWVNISYKLQITRNERKSHHPRRSMRSLRRVQNIRNYIFISLLSYHKIDVASTINPWFYFIFLKKK